ncbi:MAG: MBL fold metallo-hydrolase [Bacillota bacterium]
MRITQVSPHIWSLRSWLIVPVTVWLVREEEGLTLVDGGLSFMTGGILRFIEGLKAGPLRRILLTHGHVDHVGAVTRIRERYPVPVFAHRVELPYLEGQQLYPRRRKLEQNLPRGLAQPLPEEGDGRLSRIGGLQPYFTPGHSPGHVAYYHEQDQVLLAGDLFSSRGGRLRKPFAFATADMAEAVRSGRLVEELRPLRLEICHGGPVLHPARQMEAYLNQA